MHLRVPPNSKHKLTKETNITIPAIRQCSRKKRSKLVNDYKRDSNLKKYIYTILGRSGEALAGRPAPSTIQGNSALPLLFTVFASEVMISCNLACKFSKFHSSENKGKLTILSSFNSTRNSHNFELRYEESL